MPSGVEIKLSNIPSAGEGGTGGLGGTDLGILSRYAGRLGVRSGPALSSG